MVSLDYHCRNSKIVIQKLVPEMAIMSEMEDSLCRAVEMIAKGERQCRSWISAVQNLHPWCTHWAKPIKSCKVLDTEKVFIVTVTGNTGIDPDLERGGLIYGNAHKYRTDSLLATAVLALHVDSVASFVSM